MTINLKQVIDAVESANEVCTDLYDGISLSAAASLIFFSASTRAWVIAPRFLLLYPLSCLPRNRNIRVKNSLTQFTSLQITC